MADGSCTAQPGSEAFECVSSPPEGGSGAEGLLWRSCWPGNEALAPCESVLAPLLSSYWLGGTFCEWNGEGCVYRDAVHVVEYSYLQPLRQEITPADAAVVSWGILLAWAGAWGIRRLLASAAAV